MANKGPHGMKCPHCKEKIQLPRIHAQMFGVFMEALEKAGWSRAKCARDLQMSRRTVRNWVTIYNRLGADIPPTVTHKNDTEDWVKKVLQREK